MASDCHRHQIERHAANLGTEHQRGSSSLIFGLMLQSKSEAEQLVMSRATEVERHETIMARLMEPQDVALGEIVDHKVRGLHLDCLLMASGWTLDRLWIASGLPLDCVLIARGEIVDPRWVDYYGLPRECLLIAMCRARVPLMVPSCPPWPFPQERLLQLDTKLKAQLGRSDQARGRAARVDASIVEIRIGTERLVEMLSHVPLSKTVTYAPPALSCTRKGGGAADGEEEDEGQEPDGTPDGMATIGLPGSGEPPSTAPGAQTIVSLALHPRCVLPKGSAAEAAVSALAGLRQLASLEDTMAFGASRSLGAAVAALHNLAAIEHRLVTTVLPEIQRSDARSRMKQGHFAQRRVERLHRLSDAAAAVTVTNLMANLADQISHDLQKFDDSFKIEGAPATQTSSFFFITQATEAAAAAAETAAAEAAAAEAAAAEAAAAEAAAAEAAAAEKAAAEAAEAEAVAKAPPPATPAMRPSSAGPSAAGASTSTFMVPPRRPSSAMSKLGSIRSGGAKSKVRAVGALAALACMRSPRRLPLPHRCARLASSPSSPSCTTSCTRSSRMSTTCESSSKGTLMEAVPMTRRLRRPRIATGSTYGASSPPSTRTTRASSRCSRYARALIAC